MARIVTCGTFLVLASAMLSAQNATPAAAPDQPLQPAANFVVVLPAPTCPVSLHALQGSGTGLVAVRDAKPVSGPVQRIHLILGGGAALRVAGAKAVVYGLSGKSQILHASPRDNERSDLTKTLDIRFAPEGDKSVAADLTLPGFTSVTSVQLESISYTDGTAWKVAGERACHVAPDPLMLITER